MPRIKATRRLQFCSGHRVVNHESKCANVHGHNYVLFLYAEAPKLDGIGRVIDFSVLKAQMGTWIDENWDHTMLIYKKDERLKEYAGLFGVSKKPFMCDFNPTAENMAEYLLTKVCPLLFKDTEVTVTKIELWETENCKVEVSLDEIPHQ